MKCICLAGLAWLLSLTVLISLDPLSLQFYVVLDYMDPLFVNLDPLPLKVSANPAVWISKINTFYTLLPSSLSPPFNVG